MSHECHTPCLYCIFSVEVELRNKQVDEGNEVWDEDLCSHYIGIETPHSHIEVCSSHRGDESVDVQLHVPVGYGGKLPYCHSRDGCEQYEKGVRAEYDACDEHGYEHGARDCANDKVFHFEVRLISD